MQPEVCNTMVRWFKLTKNQYIGFFALGLAFFVLQQLPYMLMPLLRLDINPLMEMQDKSALLNIAEKTFGVSCIVIMVFLVRGDATWFSIGSTKEKVLFGAAMMAIVVYFVGWVFYFRGHHGLLFMLCTLAAMPPVYYALIGLWRRNYVLAILGSVFLVAHIANVWNNFT